MEKSIINPFGEFRNLELEEKYKEEYWPYYSKYIIMSSLFIIILSFGIDFDKIMLFNLTEEFKILLILKGLIFFSGLILILFSLSSSITKRTSFANGVFIFTTIIFFAGEQILKYDSISVNITSAVLLSTIFFYSFYNLRFIHTFAGLFLSLSAYLTGVYLYISPDLPDFILLTLIVLFANFAGIIVYYKISFLKRKAYFYKSKLHRTKAKLKKDAQEKKKLEQELEKKKQVSTPKRFQELTEVINQEFLRSKRYGQDLSILVIEIDYLSSLENKIGKKAVHLISSNFQKICEKMIRPAGDFFSRTGENQFTFVLPSTDDYGGFSLAERIREKVKKITYKINNKKIKITISTGIVSLDNEDDPVKLLEHAELALRTAQTNGRDQSLFYSEESN